MVPDIHGRGRIIYSHIQLQEVPLKKIKLIPGGPPMNQEFIDEGAEILRAHPKHDLPYITVVHDLDSAGTWWGEWWVIDGRHRYSSYKIARPDTAWFPVLVGYGMQALDKV